MASLNATITTACQGNQAQVVLTSITDAPGAPADGTYSWTVVNQATGTDYGSDPAEAGSVATVPAGTYQVRVFAYYPNGSGAASAPATRTVDCSAAPGALVLDSHGHTDETSAGNDGTLTVQASGGATPLTAAVVELSLNQPATSGQPTTFTGIPAGGPYTLRVTDSAGQQVEAQEAVAPYVAPREGCQDAYADNYDPTATTGGVDTCTYTPRWRAAWGPAGVAVRVAAVAGQPAGYLTAVLRAGFRPGHPLAADRPLADVATLRATVGPDGYATFVLAPYLRPLLGAPDGAGGWRLDLNTQTVDEGYLGYELRRADSGQLLEHGYVVLAAVPDALLPAGAILTAFGQVPTWPGYTWKRAQLSSRSAGRYGALDEVFPPAVSLACPPNPLPVAWLNPLGGFDFWVFQGKPALADSVGEGQRYREALTGEARYSERGEARRQYTASSGPYRGAALAEGLATLARSPQVWVQPDASSDQWVAVTIEGGTFPVRQWGVQRNEISVTFVTALAHYVQGQ